MSAGFTFSIFAVYFDFIRQTKTAVFLSKSPKGHIRCLNTSEFCEKGLLYFMILKENCVVNLEFISPHTLFGRSGLHR